MIQPKANREKKVLVVPLGWGLGHTTRLIPIIRMLKNSNIEVVVSGDADQVKLFQQEFGDLEVISLPHLKMSLSGSRSQIWSVILQIPKIFIHIFREHFALSRILREMKIDAIISDNCYGLWNKNITSIFITHQVWVKLPRTLKLLEYPFNILNHWIIKHYKRCWVPDLPDSQGLAGELSHKASGKLETSYIGILSRFEPFTSPKPIDKSTEKKILILISGPENQRSQFENQVRVQIDSLPEGYSYNIVRGLPSNNDLPLENWHNHLDTKTIRQLIMEANIIICRSGFSTIMDLIYLGKSAVLIPTPGQSEQEYLAKYLEQKGLFYRQSQKDFNLSAACNLPQKDPVDYTYYINTSNILLERELEQFIREL